jgi:hypothetical protein
MELQVANLSSQKLATAIHYESFLNLSKENLPMEKPYYLINL